MPTESRTQGKVFRRDIEGLRAIAVMLVFADHLFGRPTGGFLGVDVFFVISGYLITGILIREHQATGWISFSGFYARRIRRIVPAAFVVIAATVSVAYAVWYAPRANQTLLDAISALLFVSNWHFAFLGTDYLSANSPVSPLQHYWSLSVEEQFYLVWPILILGVGIAGVRMKLSRTGAFVALISTLGAVTAISFGWALFRVLSNPASAYFDSLGRAWELAIGGLAALLGPYISGSPAASVGVIGVP